MTMKKQFYYYYFFQFFSQKKVMKFNHVAILVNLLNLSGDFYRDVLGLEDIILPGSFSLMMVQF